MGKRVGAGTVLPVAELLLLSVVLSVFVAVGFAKVVTAAVGASSDGVSTLLSSMSNVKSLNSSKRCKASGNTMGSLFSTGTRRAKNWENPDGLHLRRALQAKQSSCNRDSDQLIWQENSADTCIMTIGTLQKGNKRGQPTHFAS